MQHTEPVGPSLSSTAQRRTLRLAWLTLLGFFGVFLALVGWAIYAGRQFYLSATDVRDATLVVRGPAEWVSWQPANRSIFQGIRDKQMIAAGDSVRIVTKAGYGQIASIRLFDDSQIDLWAGADLRLDTLQTTRWSDRLQEVTIRQSGGYARYDLRDKQPYRQVRFRVLVGDTSIDLTPGGSYSVAIQPSNRVAQATPGAAIQLSTTDVAVRSGTATVTGANGRSVELLERHHVEVDQAGAPGLAVQARWELIRDGSFSQFSEEEYNNTTLSNQPTLPRSTTWQVYSGPPPDKPEQQGFFRLLSICKPPEVDDLCDPLNRRTAAWFYRAGSQTSGFTTGIKQQLGQDGGGIDISEYRMLKLTLWVRVIEQSIEDVGDRGTECPVMIRILARKENPDDPDQERVACIYSDTDNLPRIRDTDVLYYQIPKATWVPLTFDLRLANWLPDYRYLQSIQIYANGHDYSSLVANVSLIGEQ